MDLISTVTTTDEANRAAGVASKGKAVLDSLTTSFATKLAVLEQRTRP